MGTEVVHHAQLNIRFGTAVLECVLASKGFSAATSWLQAYFGQ